MFVSWNRKDNRLFGSIPEKGEAYRSRIAIGRAQPYGDTLLGKIQLEIPALAQSQGPQDQLYNGRLLPNAGSIPMLPALGVR